MVDFDEVVRQERQRAAAAADLRRQLEANYLQRSTEVFPVSASLRETIDQFFARYPASRCESGYVFSIDSDVGRRTLLVRVGDEPREPGLLRKEERTRSMYASLDPRPAGRQRQERAQLKFNDVVRRHWVANGKAVRMVRLDKDNDPDLYPYTVVSHGFGAFPHVGYSRDEEIVTRLARLFASGR